MNIALEKINEKIKLITFVSCKYVYQYGYLQQNTCVGIFRHMEVFDFPNYPRNVSILTAIDALKGSYDICVNLHDENENKIIIGKLNKIEVPEDHSINIIFNFPNFILPKEGKYCFQLVVDNNVIYKYDFMAKKIPKPQEPAPEELQKLLEDPETTKSTSIEMTCTVCGRSKKFSLTLDKEKQNIEEKVPEENIIKCECGTVMDITELKARMRYFLGTKNIIDAFSRNMNKSKTLAENGFLDESLIRQISAFETFARDNFKNYYKNWFMHIFDNKNELNVNIKNVKKKIINMAGDLKLKDQFYDQLFLLESSKTNEIDNCNGALKTIIFGEEKSTINRISFQQLTGDLGCFWAYKRFFGINIVDALNGQKDGYYDHLQKCFDARHHEIHSSAINFLDDSGISPEMIEKNEKIILFIRRLIDTKLNLKN